MARPVDLAWMKGHQKMKKDDPVSIDIFINHQTNHHTGISRNIQGHLVHAVLFAEGVASVIYQEHQYHPSPKGIIAKRSHEWALQDYIYSNYGWIDHQFHLVDWNNFRRYLTSTQNTITINIAKVIYNWKHNSQQSDMFFNLTAPYQCSVRCGRIEYQQY